MRLKFLHVFWVILAFLLITVKVESASFFDIDFWCAKYVVEKDEKTGETKVKKLDGGGLPLSGVAIASSDLNQINILFDEILASFTKDINEFLNENILPDKGRGPFGLERPDSYQAKPDCLPDDPSALRKIRAYSNQLQAYTTRLALFTQSVLNSDKNRTYLTELVKRTLKDYQQKKKYQEVLTSADYDEVRRILCEYLVQRGQASVFERYEECLLSLHSPAAGQTLIDGRKELVIKRLSACYYGTLYELSTGERLWRGTDDLSNSKYYYYDASAKQWIDFDLPPADCASCDIRWLADQFEKNSLRYATPIEDIIIFIDGKDLDGASASRMLAGAFLIVEVVPGGKILKPLKGAAKVATRGTRKIAITIGKTGKRFIGEVVDGVYKPYKWIKSTAKIDEVLDVTDEVTYLAEDGVKRVGKLEVVRSGSEE